MKNLLILLASATYLSSIWAALFYFKIEDSSGSKAKKLISIIGLIAIFLSLGILVKLPSISLLLDCISAALYLCSLIIFWCSYLASKNYSLNFAFSDTTPEKLIVQGPYKWVRHPFYSSYILSWLGVFVYAPNLISLIIILLMTSIYFVAAAKEEKNILISRLGYIYQEYQYKTGRFLPKLHMFNLAIK